MTNVGLTLPWIDAVPVAVTPDNATLNAGQGSGPFAIAQVVSNVHLLATNSAGVIGLSSMFDVVLLTNAPAFTASSQINGTVLWTINGTNGLIYTFSVSTNLVQWDTLFTTNPPGTNFTWLYAAPTNLPLQFLRMKLGP